MNPVIKRLQETLWDHAFALDAADPLSWSFSARINSLGPDFYNKIISSHMILNIEYSLLGQQIRTNLLNHKAVSLSVEQKKQITEQLVAAIFLAELLEHTYQNYLIVPREAGRLRAQQHIYRSILKELHGTLPAHWIDKKTEPEIYSFSRDVRQTTANLNLYRLLFVRSKRALDLISRLDSSANWYRYIIGRLDKYTDPLLPHVAWFFYVPRLSINLFLLIKHTVPGPWMGEKEYSLDWNARFQGQLLRRWFELGNDIAWVGVGLLNCFILTGVLAPVGAYLSLAVFAFDVVMAVGRAYLELNRLYELRKQYQELHTQDPNQKAILEQLNALDIQIKFDLLRLRVHVAATTGVFLAMCTAMPLFALNPVIPLIGAACLVTICLINFAWRSLQNQYQPVDMIEIPSDSDGMDGIKKLGFFAKGAAAPNRLAPEEEPDSSCCSLS